MRRRLTQVYSGFACFCYRSFNPSRSLNRSHFFFAAGGCSWSLKDTIEFYADSCHFLHFLLPLIYTIRNLEPIANGKRSSAHAQRSLHSHILRAKTAMPLLWWKQILNFETLFPWRNPLAMPSTILDHCQAQMSRPKISAFPSQILFQAHNSTLFMGMVHRVHCAHRHHHHHRCLAAYLITQNFHLRFGQLFALVQLLDPLV